MQTNGQGKSLNLWSAMLGYLRPVAGLNIAGTVCLLLHSWLIVVIPKYIKDMINQLENHMNGADPITRQELIVGCLYIIGLSLLAATLLFLARWLIIGASRRIERAMRSDFMQHIQRLTPRFYHQNKTGDIMTRFASDIEQVRMLIGPGIMYPSTTCFTSILAMYSMYSLNPSLMFTLLVPIVVLLAYVNYNTRFLHQFYRQAQEIYSNITAMVQENFSGIRVIKAYTQEDAEMERFRDLNEKYIDRNIQQVKLRGRLFPFMRYIGAIGSILILWIGGGKVIDGSLRLGDLVQFSLYYAMLMWPIIALGWIINVIHRGMASWRRLQSIFATEPEILDRVCGEHTNGEPVLGEIDVRNLTFAYNEETQPVLKNVSFHIAPGETLAIVGPTGSGKSSIVNLLLHLYSVPSGMIFIDGKDINDFPLETLRQSIAYVSQDVFLFSDTIRSNIFFGVPNAEEIEEQRLIEAATHAHLSNEVTDFPMGYETEIGERGITLSGGQKQRTGIARALILQRPILILDDSLSNVDTQTEESILQHLAKVMENRTTILISHRMSTVQHADHIIVLDNGEIIEEGTHDELTEIDGLYARIYKRQLLEESLGIRV